MTAPRDARRRQVLCAVLAVAIAGYAALLESDLAHGRFARDLANTGNLLASWAAAAAGLARAVRSTGRRRVAWCFVGLGMLSWACGQAGWFWQESVLDQPVPFPSAPDVGYLGLAPLTVVGVLLLPLLRQTPAQRCRSVLDGLVLGGSSLLISYLLLMQPLIAGKDSTLARWAILMYPLNDVVIVTVALYLLVLLRRMGGRDPALVLIAAGMLAIALADSGYAYLTIVAAFQSGGILDAGWSGGFLLVALAAVWPGPAGPAAGARTDERPVGVMLPYAAVFTAVAVTLLNYPRFDRLTMYVWAGVIVLIGVRQVLTLLENRALTRDLEARVAERTADLYASEQRFQALVQHSSDVVTVVDADGTVTYQSESIERIFGWRAALVTGRVLPLLIGPESGARLADALRAVAGRPYGSTVLELTAKHRTRGYRQVEITVTNLLDDPSVGGLVLNTRDISERKELQEQLVHEASHDALTQLANRALFHERVAEALRGRRRTDQVAVLFLDLDGFKEVNDSLGHAAGDQLLVQVADRLRAAVRDGDTVARFGGDEFAVLLACPDLVEAQAVARRIVAAVGEPFAIDGRDVHVGASVGLAGGDPGEGTPVGAEQLMRNADLAMYRAKAAGGGDVASYDPQMHTGLMDRLQLEADLRRAVERGELVLHYQPTVDLPAGRVVGFEALMRWNHPTRGMVPPAAFIPLAEATGAIVPMGRWLLEEACRQLLAWNAGSPRPVKMAVNVSVRQFDRTDLAGMVAEVLAATGMPADWLVLEMTESVLMTDTEENLEQLVRLKALGVLLAIDDFGTGYSSLAYLRRFPVDILKIDRSFVERLGDEADAATLANTIVQLGRSLGMTVIAEGVESPRQLAALRRMGCDLAQGFHFSRPLPAEEAGRLLDVPVSPGAAAA
jgi:diguanylate cyclase (GGDEF)-like protein/PAS domain S-box-containing protein